MRAIRTKHDSPGRRARAFTVVETALSVFLLAVAMTTTVQVLGWVAHERRSAERRQWAIEEVANLMERLTTQPYDRVTPDSARAVTLSEEITHKLPEPELSIDVSEPQELPGAKRLAIELKWRNRAGAWDAPVRLTAWIARRRSGR